MRWRLCLAALLLAHPAKAAGLARYEAPAGCPSREQLALPTHEGPPPPSLDLLIEADAGRFRATLLIHDSPSQTSRRGFEAASCDEAAGAARLVAALLLSLPLTPPSLPGAPAASSAAASPVAPAPAAPAPPAAPAAFGPEVVAPPRPPAPAPRSLGAAAALQARGGVGPGARLAPGLLLRWRQDSASLELGALVARSAEIHLGGDASLSLASALLSGCAVAARPLPWLAALPCASVEVGALSGAGENVTNAASATRLHLAAGAAGRFEVSLSSSVLLSLQGGALALAARPRFFFGPDVTVYRPPWLVASGGADLTFLFY